jgi:hypothetical protein
VAFKRNRAKVSEPLGERRGFEVRAGDTVSEVEEDLGDAAHSDAADTDKMNALDFCEQRNQLSAVGY